MVAQGQHIDAGPVEKVGDGFKGIGPGGHIVARYVAQVDRQGMGQLLLQLTQLAYQPLGPAAVGKGLQTTVKVVEGQQGYGNRFHLPNLEQHPEKKPKVGLQGFF